jgi:4-hydroxy-3-methylbut-2-enyl diphosphate reductase
MELMDRIEILAPTGLEYWAARAVRPRATVRKAGIALAAWTPGEESGISIVCGLAGSLIATLEPGTVLVPDLVCGDGGSVVRCDREIRDALIQAARSLGFNPETGPLLTASAIVTGPERYEWSARGFVAADMETALVAENRARFATVRVILDSPRRSISDDWEDPLQAIVTPSLWLELLWLAEAAPRYAFRAARVMRVGLERLQRP